MGHGASTRIESRIPGSDANSYLAFAGVIAGGLLGYGVHELIEYGEATGAYGLGWWATRAYDLGIPPSDPLHNRGVIGSIFAVLVGYDTDPEWARVVAHLAYLAVTLPLVILVYRRPEILARFATRIRALRARRGAAPQDD